MSRDVVRPLYAFFSPRQARLFGSAWYSTSGGTRVEVSEVSHGEPSQYTEAGAVVIDYASDRVQLGEVRAFMHEGRQALFDWLPWLVNECDVYAHRVNMTPPGALAFPGMAETWRERLVAAME